MDKKIEQEANQKCFHRRIEGKKKEKFKTFQRKEGAENNLLVHIFNCCRRTACRKQWNGSSDVKEQKILVPNTEGIGSS